MLSKFRAFQLRQTKSICILKGTHTLEGSVFRGYATNKIKVLKSTSADPFVNLATEDWIFNDCDPNTHTLFLWRNDKTVVIGKHQNPWKECHVQKMEADGVHLVRRRSGGGAVYQDLGNTIFTFLSPKREYDKQSNFKVLLNALKNHFGIEAELSGRNDLILSHCKRKISGSAFKQGKHVCFHHGTLLVDVQMTALSNYLNPHKLKLQSKGISSVISRVANLKELKPDISHDQITNAITEQFFHHHQTSCDIEEIDYSKLSQDPNWKSYHEDLKDWNWRFGKTPEFTHNFETRFDSGLGLFDVHLNSKEGIITDAKIFSDTLYPMIVESFQTHLKGVRYGPDGVNEASKKVKEELNQIMATSTNQSGTQQDTNIMNHIDEFSEWLSSCM